ncbi:hypothetical protein GC194_09265 [bacterium]|nr:hypothetical protein [bacterium]
MNSTQKIDTLLQDLLYHHNYVIVPGFGGFVGKEIPAKVGKAGYTISPPSKYFVFNTKLVANDGLLQQQLVKEYGISYDEAEKQIEQLVKTWKSKLNSGAPVIIEEVGMFRKNIDGLIVFRHFAKANFLIPAFGLDIAKMPHRVAKTQDSSTAGREIHNNEPKTIVIEKLPVSYQRFKKISIAAIVLLSVSATYLYMLSFNPKAVDKAGLNIFDVPVIDEADLKRLEEAKRDHSELNEVLEESKKLEENNNTNTNELQNTNETADSENLANSAAEEENETTIADTAVETKQTAEAETKKEETNSKPVAEENIKSTHKAGEFHVIASVLSSSEKIDQEVKRFRLKGYEPIIIPTTAGTYRISIGKFNSRDSAETFKENILNDNNIQSWILSK